MAKRWRLFSVFVKTLCGVFLILLAILACFALWPDIAPIDDSDLLLARRQVKDADNGFLDVDLPGDAATLPDELGQRVGWAREVYRDFVAIDLDIEGEAASSREDDDDVAKAPADVASDVAAIEQALAENTEVLERFERSLQRPDFQVRHSNSINERVPYMADWRVLTYLVALRANLQRLGGDGRIALEDALKIARFGHRIELGQGSVTQCAVGMAIKGIGVNCTLALVASSEQSTKDLRRLGEELRSLEVSSAVMKDVFRADYSVMRNSDLDDVVESVEAEGGTINPLWRVWAALTFRRNRMLELLSKSYRVAVENQSDALISVEPNPKPKADPLGRGYWLVAYVLSCPPPIQYRRAALRFQLRATICFIALMHYRQVHGRYPDSLTELVPEFLPQVPLDPYDGKPLRYGTHAEVERRIVYSVGEDFIDEGGADLYGAEDLWFVDETEPTLVLPP